MVSSILLIISFCCLISLFIAVILKYSLTIGDEKNKSTLSSKTELRQLIMKQLEWFLKTRSETFFQ